MTKRVALESDLGKKLALLLATAIAISMPVVLGQVGPAPIITDLPRFEVASVKPDKSGAGSTLLLTADGLTATGVTVKFLMKTGLWRRRR
jgi:hypothetical protein